MPKMAAYPSAFFDPSASEWPNLSDQSYLIQESKRHTQDSKWHHDQVCLEEQSLRLGLGQFENLIVNAVRGNRLGHVFGSALASR
jgi:hypothetical protein